MLFIVTGLTVDVALADKLYTIMIWAVQCIYTNLKAGVGIK